MRIKKHRRVMLALLCHQGGVLTIDKADRAMRDVWLVLSRIAQQRQGHCWLGKGADSPESEHEPPALHPVGIHATYV